MDFGWLSWLWIIPVLGILVFVHELGHFVTARMNGIRVDEFGFGFPPRLFGIKRGGVMYSLNAIPVGGFVRIYGENGEGADEPYAFGAKAPWRRAIVLIAGSAMNVLLAFLIFAALAMTAGLPTVQPGAAIGSVAPGSPAQVAGLQPGDKIISVAGKSVGAQEDLRGLVQPNLGKEITVVVERGGQPITAKLTPRVTPPANEGPLGVATGPVLVNKKYNPIAAIGVGAGQTVNATTMMVRGLMQLVSGNVGVKDLAGPVGIAQVTNEIADSNQLTLLLRWTAILSLNLFLVNMLPLPALDGGRLMFVILEAVRGKKVPPQREAFVHAMGMMLLLTFLFVITFFDVQRILDGRSILP